MLLALVTALLLTAAPQAGAPAAPRALDEAQVRELFPERLAAANGEEVYDAALWFRYRAGLDVARAPREPGGAAWRLRTNALGLRMDRELTEQPADIELLFLGGANLEGACSNEDGIAARVARTLATRHADASIEALNAAHVGYGFYHHVLAFERFAARKPRICFVLVGLDDLAQCLGPYRRFSGAHEGELAPDDARTLAEARQRFPAELDEGLDALWRFERSPRALDTALAVATGLCGELAGRAAVTHTELFVLWTPPYFLIDRTARDELAEPLARLGLAPERLAAARAIGVRFADALRAMRVAALDLETVLSERGDRVFVASDRRLGPAANEVIAREIATRCEAVLARDAARSR
jgi:hypothetical protein